MTRRTWWLGLFVLMLAPASLLADSIWQRHNFFSSFLYVDTRARRQGDIVTVVIVENTDIAHQDQRNLSRSTDAGTGLTVKGNITGASQTANATVQTGLTADVPVNRGFTGASTYNINQTFADTVTCTVVSVQPNGNLVIEGYRQRVVTREVRTLRMCGVIRAMDIAFDNTIPSTYVSNFQIQYLGRGAETSFTNQSWLGRMMNRIWPF